MKKDIEFYKKRLEVLAKDNINLITENVSLSLENKELKEKFSLCNVGCSLPNRNTVISKIKKNLKEINKNKKIKNIDFDIGYSHGFFDSFDLKNK